MVSEAQTTVVDAGSPLANAHMAEELQWRRFLKENFSGDVKLLRWGQQHRVYRVGSRVAKIEMKSKVEKNFHLSIEYEYRLLAALENRACRFHPSYRVVDGSWCVLEIDHIEGEYLDDLLNKGRASILLGWRIFAKLTRISLAGVSYKQLRARHIILRPDGELAFIDLGHSLHVGALRALFQNMFPLRWKGGRTQLNTVYSLVWELWRSYRSPSLWTSGESDASLKRRAALRRWAANTARNDQGRAAFLNVYPGDNVAAVHLEAMESCIVEAIAEDAKAVLDVLEIHLCGYGLAGAKDWGFIWDTLASSVDWSGKTVVELACGMAGIGVFASLEGASKVVCFDPSPHLLRAAGHFANALQVKEIEFHQSEGLIPSAAELPRANILTVLSSRLDENAWKELPSVLVLFDEVLVQSPVPDATRELLISLGFGTVSVLMRSGLNEWTVHAAKRAYSHDS